MRNKYLFETSIQRHKIFETKNSTFYKEFSDIIKDSSCHSSNFVLYEFKTSLIYNLINFYFDVNTYGIQGAFTKNSHSFKGRLIKDLFVIQGKVATEMEKESMPYLVALESQIVYLEKYFRNGIATKLKGDFANNNIVNFEIKSKDDFLPFVELYKAEEKKIDLQTFFDKDGNKIALEKLVAERDKVLGIDSASKKKKKLADYQQEVLNDTRNAMKTNTNKALGDTVIAIDTNPDLEILTTDKSFEILCPILEKKQLRINKD